MHEIAVSILAENPERLAILQQRLESTRACHIVFAHSSFPASGADAVVRRLQDAHTEVVLVDIDPQGVRLAMHAIEAVHANVATASVFAVGVMNDPSVIVAAMRAGAREYLERDAAADSFGDALKRFSELTAKSRPSAGRARLISVPNGQRGGGATTV